MSKKRSELLAHEDYWAIWIGFFIIFAGLAIFMGNPPQDMKATINDENLRMEAEAGRSPFKTVEWFQANDAKEKVKGTSTNIAAFLKHLFGKPHSWSSNPVQSFILSDEAAAEKADKARAVYEEKTAIAAAALESAQKAQAAALNAKGANANLNQMAEEKIGQWRQKLRAANGAKKKIPKSGYNIFPYLLGLALILALLFGIGMKVMKGRFAEFIGGFLFIFALATVSYMFASQSVMKDAGVGYALWAILLGLLISNTIGTPKWVMPAVQTEFFIKTGLVLLGAEVLFGKILQIGIPGLFVAWIVTPTVILFSFWFGRKVVKMASNELNITISTAVSVCGVSAAIATAAACKAKKEELTLAVGLSLIFTAIMMVLMPAFIHAVGMDEILGGAWIGGVVDSTGAVAAAGAFLGEKALYVSATIKMIQNVLIGVVAFIVAIYWTTRMQAKADGSKPNAMEIWYRFPKFVIGFALASVLSSVIYSALGNDAAYTLVDNGLIKGMTKYLRGWMFCLAFVSIGLSTNFRELKEHFKGGKPFTLYVVGQTFNLLLTLLIAWLSFYLIFPHITAAI